MIDLTSETFRRHALDEVLRHWHEHAVDRERGGFFCELDRRWQVTDPDPRLLVATPRLVYNFAQGHMLGGPDWCEQNARHGLRFLLDAFRDAEHGGWFWQVDRTGRPTDDSKGTYGHAFVILGLSEFARAFGDADALALAEQTFDELEDHVYDPVHGGYRERHARDWAQPSDRRTQNSQMHMVEALLALGEAGGGGRYLDRAAELCRLMDSKLFDHEHGCLPEFFREDWSDVAPDRHNPIQPGHQMEWAWLLLRVHAHRPDAMFIERAAQMAAFAARHGWDEDFGGYYTDLDRAGAVTDPAKSFWPQCEGVMAPLWLWGHTQDAGHWALFDKGARYCFERFVDAEHGGWFGGLTREGEPASTRKGSGWKADYHVVQMCAEVSRFLEAMP